MSTKAKANVIKLPQNRRLSDLYVTGEEVEFDDGDGPALKVWVQKLTPAEIQKAIEAARPAKSKVSTIKRKDNDSPEKWAFYDQIEAAEMYEPIDLILFLIQPKLNEFRISTESKIADEDEWSKDDYLEGLQEAWREELYERYLEDPEDPEAKRVFDELMRFQEKVDADVEAEEKEMIYELQHLDYSTLADRVVNKLIDDKGDQALVDEFRKYQLYLSVREADDHNKRYFQSREEIDTLPAVVYNKLQMAYIDISVDSLEGKD